MLWEMAAGEGAPGLGAGAIGAMVADVYWDGGPGLGAAGSCGVAIVGTCGRESGRLRPGVWPLVETGVAVGMGI
jgi:hypothetical protein